MLAIDIAEPVIGYPFAMVIDGAAFQSGNPDASLLVLGKAVDIAIRQVAVARGECLPCAPVKLAQAARRSDPDVALTIFKQAVDIICGKPGLRREQVCVGLVRRVVPGHCAAVRDDPEGALAIDMQVFNEVVRQFTVLDLQGVGEGRAVEVGQARLSADP